MAIVKTLFPLPITDHGLLSGLSDDDHTQYHNDNRADLWFATKTTDDLAQGVSNLYFTAAEQSKLSGMEPGATADQSDSEIETAYNNQVSVATQIEAEEGTLNQVRRFTPERVKQAIEALASSGGSLIVNTRDAIVSLTPTSGQVAFSTDTNRFYVADGTSWQESSISFKVRSHNKTDRGALKDSAQSGYGQGYITAKSLHNIVVLGNNFQEFGALRSVVDPESGVQVFQVFLNGQWNTLPIDIMFVGVDANYVHNIGSTVIEIHSGNSIDRGLNGLSRVLQYKRSRGAIPYAREINGNI